MFLLRSEIDLHVCFKHSDSEAPRKPIKYSSRAKQTAEIYATILSYIFNRHFIIVFELRNCHSVLQADR